MSYTDAEIAQVCHEANRALQTIHVTQGDRSIAVSPPWYSLDEETRTSVIQGAIGVASGKTPEQSHEAWCDFKRAHGWKYGPVKNDVTKAHPCLVPYDQLPAEQRRKDHLFAAVVNALTAQLDEAAEVDDEAARIRNVVAVQPAERDVIKRAGPRIGDSVHYTSYGTPGGEYGKSCRAAIVTQVWAERGDPVGLCVLNPEGLFLNPKIAHDEGTEMPGEGESLCGGLARSGGSWHWPVG